ncbi:MAG TPA: ABC transporter ATP-binding protein [Elusimicrobiota bacterium]|nr:ABC transporter ATP-binding protein [Elusimicrobiota bacterium]
MVDSTNFNRNMKADEWRISYFRKNPSLYSTFSSKEYRTLWVFLKPQWRSLTVIVSYSFLSAILEGFKTLLQVGLIRALVVNETELKGLLNFRLFSFNLPLDTLPIVSSRMGIITTMFSGLLVLVIVVSVLKYANALLAKRVQLDLMRCVRDHALRKIFSLDLRYFDQARSGELVFLMNAETSRFSNLVTFAERFLTFFVQTAIFLLIMVYMSWDVTLVLILVAIIYFKLHIPLDMRTKQRSWESNLAQNTLSHLFHQIVYGIKVIKIGACEEREQTQYLEEHKNFEQQDISLTKLNGLSTMFREFGGVAILLIIGVYSYIFKDYHGMVHKSDQILAYLFLLIRTLPTVAGLQDARTSMISAYGPLARVMSLLHETESLIKPLPQATESLRVDNIQTLACKNVVFSYTTKKTVLEGIDLHFHKNSIYAFVGPSGSGKSSILDLLASVRFPNEGDVLINDISLKHLEIKSYKQLVGYMNQDPVMFHNKIRMNVTYFKPDATNSEIWEALRLAAVDDFIKGLPDGLETGLGERGLTVSGGQRQRIGLARIFLQNTPVLLLDEATNALDYKTEEMIYANLKTLKMNRIIIVAAHRLSTLKDFDQIIVLNKGRIEEQGTHTELMNLKSLYYNLFSIQERSVDDAE